MQLFFKEHFQPIVFQKLKDWKFEKCCMKDDICLLDDHQKSHWNAITICLKGMINRVLQFNNSQLESSFNSLLEKHLVLNLPNQPNPNPNQSVIERGNLWTQNVFLWRKEKRPVHKRLLVTVCKKNLVLHIERWNPWRMKTIASCMFTIELGNPWNQAQTHTVQEFGSPEHRDTASSNANKFNLAIDEENIDFNISGVPNAMVKRSHGINVHNLIHKIENNPQRQALQNDLQQHRAFNPFSEESQDAIKAAGNTELCEIVDVEPKAQCRACLTYWDVGIVYCTCGHFLRDDTTENEKYISSVLDLFSIPNFYIRKGRPHGHRFGKKGCEEFTRQNNFKRGVERNNMITSTTDSSATSSSEKRWLSWVDLKRSSLGWIGLEAKTTVILPPKKKLMFIVVIGGSVRIWLIPTRCR